MQQKQDLFWLCILKLQTMMVLLKTYDNDKNIGR